MVLATLGLFAYVYFMVPWSDSHSLFQRSVKNVGGDEAESWQETFEVTASAPRFNLHIRSAHEPVHLLFDLNGPDNCKILWDCGIKASDANFQCGRNLPPGSYTLRVREQNRVPEYVITVSTRASFSLWQKFGLLIVALFASSLLWFIAQKHSVERKETAKRLAILVLARYCLVLMSLSLSALILYLLLHEGGHAIASLSFGSFDFSRSDFFGIHGSPHAGTSPDVHLPSWQRAIEDIAGPLLPTFAGYIVFALWATAWGRRMRQNNIMTDMFWSCSLFILLFPIIGLFIPMIGISADGDYDGFVKYAPLARWQINTLLSIVVIINAVILCKVVPHLRRLKTQFMSSLKQEWNRSVQMAKAETEQSDGQLSSESAPCASPDEVSSGTCGK